MTAALTRSNCEEIFQFLAGQRCQWCRLDFRLQTVQR